MEKKITQSHEASSKTIYNYSVVDVLKVAYWSDRLIKDLLAFVALLAFGRLCSGDVYDVCIWTSFYHW